MKKVININLSGRVIPIEDSAYEKLQSYIESLRRHFANEEGREEIINDIESRIAELFDEQIKKGASAITDTEVNGVISSMGRPEDFESAETATISGPKTEKRTYENQVPPPSFPKRLYRDENHKVIGGVCAGLANHFNLDRVLVRIIFILTFGVAFWIYLVLWIAVSSSASTVIGSPRKKLYRDPDDKIIGGVCSGLGHYFGINPWIPRILFLLPFISFVFRWGRGFYDFDFPHFFSLTFSPGALVIYIILWIVIPEAFTTTDKLEMKGEKVDVQSIKNSVVEMKSTQQRVEEKSGDTTAEATTVVKKKRNSLGDVILFIVKLFGYFIIGCIAIALIIGLFAIAVTSIGLFPLKDFVLRDGSQNALAWGALIFFLGVSIVGLLTWIIRRLARVKTKSRMMRLSFLTLWLVGLFCFIGLIVSVGKDFRSQNNPYDEEISITNQKIDKLEITTSYPSLRFNSTRWMRFEPFEGLFEDTAFVRNVRVQIIKSTNDSFRVTMTKFANGSTRRNADTLARLIVYNVFQQDSLLIADKGISINKKDKFRNQQVLLTVYVPVGKKIRVNRNIGWGDDVHFDGPWNRNYWDFYDNEQVEHGWEMNVDYEMKADGLYTLDGKPADEWKHADKRNNYRNRPSDDLKNRKKELQEELKQIQQQEKQDSIDKKPAIRDSAMRDAITYSPASCFAPLFN
jgi:phage shock protein PspC (stress-responsive transcriptional regulator)